MKLLRDLVLASLVLSGLACVNVDPETGEVIPRGDQYFKFEEVKKRSERLRAGMRKLEVQALLGAPAEKGNRGDTWVYVPERPAVLIPAKALRLEFHNGGLQEWGYHSIVLGQQL